MSIKELKALIEDVRSFVKLSPFKLQLENIIHDSFIKEELDFIYAIILDIANFSSNTLDICIEYLLETVMEINAIIHAIAETLDDHSKLWFSGWRTPNIYIQLEKLAKLRSPLHSRTKRFYSIARTV